MKTVFTLTALLILLISSQASGGYKKPEDVYGWDKLKWGMTEEEVRSVYGEKIKIHKPKQDEKEGVYSGMELTGVETGGGEFRASLWMDSATKRLKKIVFVPAGKPEGYKRAETFINLEESLSAAYGDPDFEETSNDPGTSAERKWVFPSTVIEMSYLRIEDTELLLLIFSENDKGSD